MYTAKVPFKNYRNQPRTKEVTFQLEIRDVIKNLLQLHSLIRFFESRDEEDRTLSNEEMVDFFNDFETIILAAWGEISEDGDRFERSGRYQFEESKLFAAFMEMMLSNVGEVNNILTQIIPDGMDEMIRKQGESIAQLKADGAEDSEIQAKLAEIQATHAAEIAKLQAQIVPSTEPTV